MGEQPDPLPEENESRRLKVIAGPCSAESLDQLVATASALKELPITYFRAGLWKPRSRPNSFCGVGAKGLPWLCSVREQFGFRILTEVARPQHAEAALRAGIDALWLGARCVSDPFSVDELAQALKGVSIPIFVKNPIAPDCSLWVGAIERLMNAGVRHISAVFRGYNTYFTAMGSFRNTPLWSEAFALRKHFPSIPLICDPSHIAGKRKNVIPMARLAAALGFDGLMIETHIHPDQALSDSEQQLTPSELADLLQSLPSPAESPSLEAMRYALEENDLALLAILAERYRLVERIGGVKQANEIPVIQPEQYDKKIAILLNTARREGLNSTFVSELFNLIHAESVRLQEELRSQEPQKQNNHSTNDQ